MSCLKQSCRKGRFFVFVLSYCLRIWIKEGKISGEEVVGVSDAFLKCVEDVIGTEQASDIMKNAMSNSLENHEKVGISDSLLCLMRLVRSQTLLFLALYPELDATAIWKRTVFQFFSGICWEKETKIKVKVVVFGAVIDAENESGVWDSEDTVKFKFSLIKSSSRVFCFEGIEALFLQ